MRKPRPAFAALAAAAWITGCVSAGTHRSVVEERDQLQDRLNQLERSAESLRGERVALLEESENLRESSKGMQRKLDRLRRQHQDLQSSLADREEQLTENQKALDALAGTYDALVSDLESEVAAGQIEIERLREGLRVNLSQEILFPTGSARLNAAGRGVIGTVASRLRELDQRVEVQGHTDDVPIKGALALRYPSNWELAAARASEVVRLLESQGVAPERLTAVSFGEHRPVAPNDSAKGRSRNRRIEIRLLPPEPVVAPPAD